MSSMDSSNSVGANNADLYLGDACFKELVTSKDSKIDLAVVKYAIKHFGIDKAVNVVLALHAKGHAYDRMTMRCLSNPMEHGLKEYSGLPASAANAQKCTDFAVLFLKLARDGAFMYGNTFPNACHLFRATANGRVGAWLKAIVNDREFPTL